MPHNDISSAPAADPAAEFRTHAEALEQRLAEVEQEARLRVLQAELKVEAMRAGMVDLDGLKLLDPNEMDLTLNGSVANATEMMSQLRRAKPWLFGGMSSSSPASPPPAQPARQKLATDMSDEEYRAARAALLKHQP